VRRLPPKVGAHTTAERQEKALEVVVIPRLSLRDEILWRGPLNEPRPLSKPSLKTFRQCVLLLPDDCPATVT